MVLIEQLKIGDVVQHIKSGNAYEVVIVSNGRAWAVRDIEISNPDEWFLVDITSRPSKIAAWLLIDPNLSRLYKLVQENQVFFGDPPAGESCVKVVADKLEELIKGPKRPGVQRTPTETQEENEELVELCEALVNHIVGMYASGGESVGLVIKARAAIARSRGE